MKKRCLVTGGFGFIGSHIAEKKAMDRYEVFVYDNMLTSTIESYLALRSLVHYIIEPTKKDISKMDEIYHLASVASPTLFDIKARDIVKANVGLTFKLLENCKPDVKFFYASSSEIYGNDYCAPEEWPGHVSPIGPRAIYDESKRLGEAICSLYHRQRGLNITIGRIFNTYGPRMAHDGRVIQTFIEKALAGKPLPIYGSGSQTRSFCYIDDMVEAILTVVEKNKGFDVVNLGNDEEITILRLTDKILVALGGKVELEFLPKREEPRVRKPDLNKLKRKYGFTPKISLEEGLRRTIEWHRR